MSFQSQYAGTWFEGIGQELASHRVTEGKILGEMDNPIQGERSDSIFEELRLVQAVIERLTKLEVVAQGGFYARLISYERDLSSARCRIEFTDPNNSLFPDKETSCERHVADGQAVDFINALIVAFRSMLDSIGYKEGFEIVDRRSTYLGTGATVKTSVTICGVIGNTADSFIGTSEDSCVFRSSFLAMAHAIDQLVFSFRKASALAS